MLTGYIKRGLDSQNVNNYCPVTAEQVYTVYREDTEV